jgi:hypothetical protein
MSTTQAFGAAADIPLLIKSANAQSERRVNPSWTIAHFKARLEPITGVPSSTQRLSFRIASQDAVPIEAANEEQVQLSSFGLQPYAEVTVSTDRVFFAMFPPIRSPARVFGYPTVWHLWLHVLYFVFRSSRAFFTSVSWTFQH